LTPKTLRTISPIDRATVAFGQLHGQRGQRVPALVAHQKLVPEVPAQPRQRRARRGLGDPEPLRGPGDVLLAEQLAQAHEQVQVQAGQVAGGTGHRAPSIAAPATGSAQGVTLSQTYDILSYDGGDKRI